MTQVRLPDPVLLIVAAFSRYPELLARSRDELEHAFGPVALASQPYDFVQTKYYEATMGPALRKHFLVFHNLIAADGLAEIKLQTNDMEQQLLAFETYPEPRPLNLDPGILALGKFMLATTKDQAHRIYLHSGIFAEVTLRFEAAEFAPWLWTYADYRQPCVLDFMKEAREFYRVRLVEWKRNREKGEKGAAR